MTQDRITINTLQYNVPADTFAALGFGYNARASYRIEGFGSAREQVKFTIAAARDDALPADATYKQVYECAVVMRAMCWPLSVLARWAGIWSAGADSADLTDENALEYAAYVWPLYMVCTAATVIDWDLWFRRIADPFGVLAAALKLDVVKESFDMQVRLFEFVAGYNFKLVFNENTPAVHQQVRVLEAGAKAFCAERLFDPFSAQAQEWFVYTPTAEPRVTPEQLIAAVDEQLLAATPAIGAKTVVARARFEEDFHRATNNLFADAFLCGGKRARMCAGRAIRQPVRARLPRRRNARRNESDESDDEHEHDDDERDDDRDDDRERDDEPVPVDDRDVVPADDRADKEPAFPWQNVVFAGGLIAKLAAGIDIRDADFVDIDLFIIGRTYDAKRAAMTALLAWFDWYGRVHTRAIWYAVRGSVVDVYIEGFVRKIQIVSNRSNTAFEVIDRFDLSSVQWLLYRGEVKCNWRGALAQREYAARYILGSLRQEHRFIKQLMWGYSVYTAPLIEEYDLAAALEQVDALRDWVTVMFDSYSVPMRAGAAHTTAETRKIAAKLKKGAKCVTTDTTTVLQNVSLEGDFDTSYSTRMYNLINLKAITANNRQVRTSSGRLLVNSGPLTLTACTIIDDANAPYAYTLLCAVPQPLVEFMREIAAMAGRLLHKECVTKFNPALTFYITAFKHATALERGRSLLQNAQGKPLDMTVLTPGDSVQILYEITVKVNYGGPDGSNVELTPAVLKVMRLTETVDTNFAAAEETTALAESEAPALTYE